MSKLPDRDFKGVWIPKELWLDKTINPMQKFFLLEIDSLDNSRGCYASNAHFSELFGLTKRRCGQIVRELEEMGLVTVRIEFEAKEVKKRIIKVVNPLYGGKFISQGVGKICAGGWEKNATWNNTSKAITPRERKKAKKPPHTLPDDVDENLWQEWMQIRKKLKAVNSDRAIEMLLRRLDDCRAHGIPPDKAIATAIEHSWKSIQPEWINRGISLPDEKKDRWPGESIGVSRNAI